MHKYSPFILLTIALTSPTRANANQITIINKLNLPLKCTLLWNQDPTENAEQGSLEKISIITRLKNDPTPQPIKIPSIYKATGFRIACDSIVYPTVVNGHEEDISLVPGKTYILERIEDKKILITQN